MTTYATFTLELEITDEQALLAAARKRAKWEGSGGEEIATMFLDDEGEIDVSACLVMLLDPGSPPDGTEIEDSSCELFHTEHEEVE